MRVSRPIHADIPVYVNDLNWCAYNIALGGNIPTIFSRRSTHLICPSGHGMKYDKAKEWGVSVVGLEWLFTIATTGKIPPAHEFEVAHNVGEAAAMLTDKVDHGMDVKGKGKATMAVEEDGLVAIIDITNGRLVSCSPSSLD